MKYKATMALEPVYLYGHPVVWYKEGTYRHLWIKSFIMVYRTRLMETYKKSYGC